MHEDVAASYFAKQEPLSRLIEKGDHVPGKGAYAPEPEAQGEVLKKALQPHFLN